VGLPRHSWLRLPFPWSIPKSLTKRDPVYGFATPPGPLASPPPPNGPFLSRDQPPPLLAAMRRFPDPRFFLLGRIFLKRFLDHQRPLRLPARPPPGVQETGIPSPRGRPSFSTDGAGASLLRPLCLGFLTRPLLSLLPPS